MTFYESSIICYDNGMKIGFLILVAAAVIAGGYFTWRHTHPTQTTTMETSTSPSVSASPSTTTLGDKVEIVMQTARGEIDLELYPKVAPKTVANFVKLSQSGF